MLITKQNSETKKNQQKKIAYQWSFHSAVGMLYWLKGFDTTYEFILMTIEMDESFKDNLRKFANTLYGFRETENAKKCFEKLLVLDKDDKKAKDMIERILEEESK
ncbi:MAG: hypothetical protein ACTSPK_06945 [Candidatus Heimdallarchaeota archaeon]